MVDQHLCDTQNLVQICPPISKEMQIIYLQGSTTDTYTCYFNFGDINWYEKFIIISCASTVSLETLWISNNSEIILPPMALTEAQRINLLFYYIYAILHTFKHFSDLSLFYPCAVVSCHCFTHVLLLVVIAVPMCCC